MLAVACLSLATKMEEIKVPLMVDLQVKKKLMRIYTYMLVFDFFFNFCGFLVDMNAIIFMGIFGIFLWD